MHADVSFSMTLSARCDVPWHHPFTQEQGNSDSVLDDVACMLSCTRSSLHGALEKNHINV